MKQSLIMMAMLTVGLIMTAGGLQAKSFEPPTASINNAEQPVLNVYFYNPETNQVSSTFRRGGKMGVFIEVYIPANYLQDAYNTSIAIGGTLNIYQFPVPFNLSKINLNGLVGRNPTSYDNQEAISKTFDKQFTIPTEFKVGELNLDVKLVSGITTIIDEPIHLTLTD